MTISIEQLEEKGWKKIFYDNTIVYLNISPQCFNKNNKYIYYEYIDEILYKKIGRLSKFKNYILDE